MDTLELKDHRLSSLFALIESQPAGHRHIFRGQPNAKWGLVPTLYRSGINVHDETLEKSYDVFEQRCIERFFNEGLPYLPAIQRSYSNDRILAQHFGAPTRLLDWSRDPLVATFFAVENWQSNEDAALFMILPDAKHRPEDVRSLGPHKAIELEPPAIDRRIPAQKSVFTFHQYGPPDRPFIPLDKRTDIGNIVATGPTGSERVRGFAKIVVRFGLKQQLYHALLALGVDRRNLFPGLDGVGTDIAARARVGQIW